MYDVVSTFGLRAIGGRRHMFLVCVSFIRAVRTLSRPGCTQSRRVSLDAVLQLAPAGIACSSSRYASRTGSPSLYAQLR